MLRHQDEAQDPPDFDGQWEGFPHVARARMNLTALSQHYDLYFVAYRGYIYVYRLNRGVKIALGEPEAILDPKNDETAMAKHVGGYINPNCPDEINHMIVGELGDEEILLVGRDNGDVVAWYTQSIAHHVEAIMTRSARSSQRDKQPPCDLPRRPGLKRLFADNVGISAWGLAIHKKSRLIAVSSNAHEISVFAFAMNRKGESASPASSGAPEDDTHKSKTTHGKETVDITPYDTEKVGGQALEGATSTSVLTNEAGQLPASTWKPATKGPAILRKFMGKKLPKNFHEAQVTEPDAKTRIAKLQSEFQTRKRSWRIVLSLGTKASNVPSIAFCEDADGNADRVAGIDINGYLFIVYIWHIGRKPIMIPPHNVKTRGGRRHTPVRGWNLLPVTDAQLLPTDTVHAATGVHPSKAIHRAITRRGAWLDISQCMAEVAYDAASKNHQRRIANYWLHDNGDDEDGLMLTSFSDDDWDRDDEPTTPPLSSQTHDPVLDPRDGVDYGGGPVSLAMTMEPYSGAQHAAFPTPQALVQFAGTRAALKRAQEVRAALTLRSFREKARAWEAEDLLRDVSFLRFNEHDVEMLSLGETDCGAVCNQ